MREMFEHISKIVESVSSDAWMGLIGTVVGAILGAFVSWISRKGKLSINIDSFENQLNFPHYEDNSPELIIGGKKRILESSVFFDSRINLQIFNSSGDSNIIQNMVIVLRHDKKEILVLSPKPADGTKASANIVFHKHGCSATIPAKSLLVLSLTVHDSTWTVESEELSSINNIVLRYKNTKGKLKTIHLEGVNYKETTQNYIANQLRRIPEEERQPISWADLMDKLQHIQ